MDAKKLLSAWHALDPHPVQQALATDKVRFKVCAAGRRSGKSMLAKRHVVREAMRVPGDYFIATPTYGQSKKIHWRDCKQLAFASILPQRPSESELTIYLPNGSTIVLVGLDKPERIEGVSWAGGVVDEIANVKESAWHLHIRPALDTWDKRRNGELAWCWLIGTPEGRNHFWEMAEYARTSGDPDWKFYTWPSADLLPAAVIEAAKRSLSPQQYAQEYLAAFENATGRIYDDYSSELNTTQETIKPHEQLLFSFDFNYAPQSSCISVRRGVAFYVLDEIILQSANSRLSALEFVDRYKAHANKHVLIFGDPAGKCGEKHGLASSYTELEQVLREHGWKVERQVRAAAPAIRDRQQAVRAMICNAKQERRLFVNPSKCKYVHKGLLTLSVKEGSQFLEEQTEYGHVTTALGYMIERLVPIRPEVKKAEPTIATIHHWPKAGQWGSR